MKRTAAALIVFLAAIPSATADEPDLRELVEVARGATPLRDAWERCTAAAVRKELQSKRSPQQLADEALSRCQAQETKLRAALARARGGAEGHRVTTLLRRMHRTDLIAVIDLLRRDH